MTAWQSTRITRSISPPDRSANIRGSEPPAHAGGSLSAHGAAPSGYKTHISLRFNKYFKIGVDKIGRLVYSNVSNDY